MMISSGFFLFLFSLIFRLAELWLFLYRRAAHLVRPIKFIMRHSLSVCVRASGDGATRIISKIVGNPKNHCNKILIIILYKYTRTHTTGTDAFLVPLCMCVLCWF